jgi:hypothetical protein
MTEFTGADEVRDRLNLIESMVLEGRRGTERWGWAFVLWGVAYYAAIVWSAAQPSFGWAWPITVIAALLIMSAIRRARGMGYPWTSSTRSIVAIWIAFGISAFVLFCALGMNGLVRDAHVIFAILAAMLGMVNGASGILLRWKAQIACAVVWWAAAVACCYGDAVVLDTPVAFLVALFLCQIVFGVYCMMLDGRVATAQRQSHA